MTKTTIDRLNDKDTTIDDTYIDKLKDKDTTVDRLNDSQN